MADSCGGHVDDELVGVKRVYLLLLGLQLIHSLGERKYLYRQQLHLFQGYRCVRITAPQLVDDLFDLVGGHG
jgi:hypothetical protein